MHYLVVLNPVRNIVSSCMSLNFILGWPTTLSITTQFFWGHAWLAEEDEAYLSKRKRIDDVIDQKGRMKMDGLNEDDDDAPLVLRRSSVTIKSKKTSSFQNNTSVTSQRVVSNTYVSKEVVTDKVTTCSEKACYIV